MYTLARVVRLATTVAVALLVAGILIHLLGANTSNGIVSALNDAAKWLAQPFDNVFKLHNAKTNVAVNWGLAGVFHLDLVASVFGLRFGETSALSSVVYALVGLSGLYQALTWKSIQRRWDPATADARA